jgi:hypothetical protein
MCTLQDVLRTGKPLHLLEVYVGTVASMNKAMQLKNMSAIKLGLAYGHNFLVRRDRVRGSACSAQIRGCGHAGRLACVALVGARRLQRGRLQGRRA